MSGAEDLVLDVFSFRPRIVRIIRMYSAPHFHPLDQYFPCSIVSHRQHGKHRYILRKQKAPSAEQRAYRYICILIMEADYRVHPYLLYGVRK